MVLAGLGLCNGTDAHTHSHMLGTGGIEGQTDRTYRGMYSRTHNRAGRKVGQGELADRGRVFVCCTVLYCTVLYSNSTVLYCTVLYCHPFS